MTSCAHSPYKLSCLSGFGWDDNLKMVTALPAVWDELRNKSHMKKYLRWEHTPFPAYDEMLFLVDGIIVTGSTAFHAGSHPFAYNFVSSPPAGNIHDTDDKGHNISISQEVLIGIQRDSHPSYTGASASPSISEAMLHHRLIHTPTESPWKPAKHICALTESPLNGSGCVIFRAAQVNSASPEPTPGQVRLLRSSVPLLFRLLLNILVPVP
ncbi:hypothetical protein PAXRUDRAFT_14598 [Paxillus rubicundulus Ve08.2h10]|uniref:Uncharacterized protein n=1 Tax=Paxillus rubicundulus Ve08.2h10 TaxID=930991 RepID=A0A0D0D5A3_9AGAM|nr:hypothetical protein PAXRUDRAFT_14598 [Paxillus rubicundulus Ve08.2h10]